MARLKAAQISQVVSSIIGEVILLSTRSFLLTLLASYYSSGLSQLDQNSIQNFKLDLESADSAVSGAVYANDLTKVFYTTSNDSFPQNLSLPTSLFPLDTKEYLDLDSVNINGGYMEGPVLVDGQFYMSTTRPLVRYTQSFESPNRGFVQSIIGYLTIVSKASSLLNVTRTLNLEDGTRMALVKLEGNLTHSQLQQEVNLNYSLVIPSDICISCYGHSYHLFRYFPSYFALVNGTSGTMGEFEIDAFGKVAIGYAPVPSIPQVWAVLILQAHSVLYSPIRTLRSILLAAVFSIGVGVCIVTFFLSGWMVKPITRLQAATEQSTSSGPESPRRSLSNFFGFFGFFSRRPQQDPQQGLSTSVSKTAEFKIPEKVVTRKYIKDELTELTETFNDMTTELRKQYAVLEERVLQRTKEIKTAKVHAETANEAKSLFIANITHELRTPLNGILGMAAVSMEETNPSVVRDSLKVISKSGELLLRLLTDLLSFPKSQVENMQLEPKSFYLTEITAQLHAIFDEQSRSSNIAFSISLAPEILTQLELLGDMNRILQVVMNLVSNGLKFTPAEGSVTVQISAAAKNADGVDLLEIPFDVLPENLKSLFLRMLVRDTGPGIAPHLQSKIFEPFVQGDLALSEKRGGVGLGLSICRQFAHLMHGDVSLTSEFGHGCEFTFEVPLEVIGLASSQPQPHTDELHSESFDLSATMAAAPTPCQVLQKKPGTDSIGRRKSHSRDLSLLIAEDNRVNQEVMVRMLKLEGLTNIKVAKDGLEAVNAVKSSLESGVLFDIIFMDIQMPNLDGKQATTVIRTELHYSGTIIAVSAYSDDTNIDSCLQVGMNYFLPKPLRRPQLHSLLCDLDPSPPS